MNSYQGILITDGSRTYALFIYNCSQLNRDSVAGIGYFFNSSLFEEHALSNTDQSSMVACVNSLCSPSLVVYPLFGMFRFLVSLYDFYHPCLTIFKNTLPLYVAKTGHNFKHACVIVVYV